MGRRWRVDTRCHARVSGHPVTRERAIAAAAVRAWGRGEPRGHPAPCRTGAVGPGNVHTRAPPPFAGQRGIALLHDPASAASPAGGIPGA
jgi:hypothetical protein